jgi:CRP-like cAMP-binding protein
MTRFPALAQSQLFEGLSTEELEVVLERMRPRRLAAGEQLCAAGEPTDRIWLITGGLVNWTAGTTTGGGEIELRMRKGDVIGAQDAITATERTATVTASTITDVLELSASDLLALAERSPASSST